jgi:hypothetical protein
LRKPEVKAKAVRAASAADIIAQRPPTVKVCRDPVERYGGRCRWAIIGTSSRIRWEPTDHPGAAAVECLARGEHGVLVGLIRDEVATTPLSKVVNNRKSLDPQLLALARVLAK